MIDYISIISTALAIIGGATILFRIIAPITETNVDNKILAFLEGVLSNVSLNRDTSKLEIKVVK